MSVNNHSTVQINLVITSHLLRSPIVEITQTPDVGNARSSGHLELTARFLNLSSEQKDVLSKVVAALPMVLAQARANNNLHCTQQFQKLHVLPDSIVDQLIAETWESHRALIELAGRIPVIGHSAVKKHCGSISGDSLQWLIHLSYGGRSFYPAFQFGTDGAPLSSVLAILKLIRKQINLNEVEITRWFLSPNSDLQGARPVDVVPRDPAAVQLAAQQWIGGSA